MARNPWVIYRRLTSLDVRVLKAVEAGMNRYEYVPVEFIERRFKGNPRNILESLDKLNKEKLIVRGFTPSLGYKLTYTGLDIIALNNLVARQIIVALGDRIGAGKEGNIYLGEDPLGNPLVVKFHREGFRSFSEIKRARSYAVNLPRKSWLKLAKLVGEREFKVMSLLHEYRAKVPEPIAWNRHVVVQEYIPGTELYKIARGLSVRDARSILAQVMETIRIAYRKVGIVHGDLSEYNILVTEDLEAYVIDWPQFLYREEEGAEILLRRDIEHVVSFFNRRFRLGEDPLVWLSYVTGEESPAG